MSLYAWLPEWAKTKFRDQPSKQYTHLLNAEHLLLSLLQQKQVCYKHRIFQYIGQVRKSLMQCSEDTEYWFQKSNEAFCMSTGKTAITDKQYSAKSLRLWNQGNLHLRYALKLPETQRERVLRRSLELFSGAKAAYNAFIFAPPVHHRPVSLHSIRFSCAAAFALLYSIMKLEEDLINAKFEIMEIAKYNKLGVNLELSCFDSIRNESWFKALQTQVDSDDA